MKTPVRIACGCRYVVVRFIEKIVEAKQFCRRAVNRSDDTSGRAFVISPVSDPELQTPEVPNSSSFSAFEFHSTSAMGRIATP